MNINVNSTISNIKGKSILSKASSIIDSEKINLDSLVNVNNSILKSDSYSNTSINLSDKNFASLFSLVKKILYSDSFREIAINSNPQLKEAFDNFINAIAMDESELGEYIKSVLNDSNTFSGEFFLALNKILQDTNDTSLKNSIYEFIKIYDYYFTQVENASSTNSALFNILLEMPEDLKNNFLELLSNNSTSKLNMLLSSAFELSLPEKEKLKVILSSMLDFVISKDNPKIEEPLNIFMPKEQISNDSLDFICSAVKALKNSNIELSSDVKLLLEALDSSVIKLVESSEVKDKLTWWSASKEKDAQIETIVKLAEESTNGNNSIIIKNLKEATMLIQDVKGLSTLHDLKGIDVKSLDANNVLLIFDKIKNELLLNNSYPKDLKNQFVIVFHKVADNLLDNLLFSQVPKNKSELLLNLYEKEIMPLLLKNNSILPQNALSSLTHNLLRLKLGTANEFSRQVEDFFNHFEYNDFIDKEQVLYLKFQLISKITSKHEANESTASFLKLLDNGLKYSGNDTNKAVFENVLLSLIPKNEISSAYKHLFLPLLYNGVQVLSEIFINKEKKVDDNMEDNYEEILDSIFKVSIIFDIEDKGKFDTTLFYTAGQVSAKVIIPENYKASYEEIAEDISKIIQKNNLISKKVLVTNDIT